MATGELKSEIYNALYLVPEIALSKVLDFLNQIDSNPKDDAQLNAFIDRIFVEDGELLKRLAK